MALRAVGAGYLRTPTGLPLPHCGPVPRVPRVPVLTLRQLHVVHRGQEHISMQLLLFWGPSHCQLEQFQGDDVMVVYRKKNKNRSSPQKRQI